MKPRITYTENVKPFVLESLGYEVGEDGYMMKDGKRAKTVSGLDVQEHQVMGFHKDGIIASVFDLMTLEERYADEEESNSGNQEPG